MWAPPRRAWRSTEWRPGWAVWQFGHRRRAAIGELTVKPRADEYETFTFDDAHDRFSLYCSGCALDPFIATWSATTRARRLGQCHNDVRVRAAQLESPVDFQSGHCWPCISWGGLLAIHSSEKEQT
jgi:hypothetical protein